MGVSSTVPELVAAAQADAKTLQDQISGKRDLVDGQAGSRSHDEQLGTVTGALETVAVDVFSAFEARMQHHFRRGPFSRKLVSLLLASDKADLAERVRQYYLAVNVLKHGKGASYRELLDAPGDLVIFYDDGENTSASLIDVSAPGFFDGLTATILEAYHFLENR